MKAHNLTRRNKKHPKHLLKRVLLPLFLSLCACASAQPHVNVKFDDTGFNYYAKGKDNLRTGYVHLDYTGDALTVSLSDRASPMKIEYARMKQSKDSRGKKQAWKHHDIETRVQSFAFAEGRKHGVNVLHHKAYLGPVMSAYDAAFTRLGFDMSGETRYANTRIDIYSNDEGSVKVIFTRKGNDIRVRMLEL